MRRLMCFVAAPILAIMIWVFVPTTASASEVIYQTDYGTTWAEVQWDTPASDKYGVITQYKIEWGQNGKYTESHTVQGDVNKYRITGLSVGSEYNVKISYKYIQDEYEGNTDGGVIHTVEYGNTDITTGLGPMTPSSDWKYSWRYGGGLTIKVPSVSKKLIYHVVVCKGSKANFPTWTEMNDKSFVSTKGNTICGSGQTNKLNYTENEVVEKQGVVCVGIRPLKRTAYQKSYVTSFGEVQKIGYTIAGGWQKKICVPDPDFKATRVRKKGKDAIQVTINPVKYAKTYDVYMWRYVGEHPDGSPYIKGLKKVKQVKAKSGKKVKVTIDRFKNQPISNQHWYGVQVVNNSKYGKSTRTAYSIVHLN